MSAGCVGASKIRVNHTDSQSAPKYGLDRDALKYDVRRRKQTDNKMVDYDPNTFFHLPGVR
jgi:glutamate/tyrosine decarboxylase-like PLP-dependent enzyme